MIDFLEDILMNSEEVPFGEMDAVADVDTDFTPFPVDAFHPVLRDMISEVARFANVDASIPAIGVLTIAAAIIGGTYRIVHRKPQPSILWGVIVIPSGEGKSDATDELMEPLVRIDRRWAKENDSAMEVYTRAYADWDRRRKAATRGKNSMPFDEPSPMKPPMKRLVVNETTVEALFGTLQDNPDGIIVYKDEFAEWFAMNVYTGAKGKDESFWNASFNGKSYSVDRKTTQSNRIDRTIVSILGGIQPSILRGILKKDAKLTDSGLTLRPIYTMPPVLKHLSGKRTIDAGIRARYERLVDDLLKLREPPSPQTAEAERRPDILPSAEAERVYDAFIESNGEEHSRLADSPLKSYLARMRGSVLRVALDLHCVNQVADGRCIAEEVSGETMRNAVRIAEWAKYEFRRVFVAFGLQPDRTSEADRDAKDILRVIDQHDVDGGATVTDFQHGINRFRGRGYAERVEQKLLELKHAGVVESETEMTGGRAVTRYRRA